MDNTSEAERPARIGAGVGKDLNKDRETAFASGFATSRAGPLLPTFNGIVGPFSNPGRAACAGGLMAGRKPGIVGPGPTAGGLGAIRAGARLWERCLRLVLGIMARETPVLSV